LLAGDLYNISRQVRRLVNDKIISGTGVRSDIEIIQYTADSLTEIEQDFPEFPAFSISGTLISPVPDNIDKRLMALKTAELITYEDWRESAGDAILIKTGSIALDTSKGTRFFKDVYEGIKDRYDKMITNLNMNGKSTGTGGVGARIDNYIVDKNSSKAGESLL